MILVLTAFFPYLSSCHRDESTAVPLTGGILTPLTESTESNEGDAGAGSLFDQAVTPLVNPGENYNILGLLDVNLDTDTSDEQVLVTLPLDDEDAPLRLMIATTNPIRNQYAIVWEAPLSLRSLRGVALRANDVTGNGRMDLIVTGFNEEGRHATEIFGVSKRGDIRDYKRIFSLLVDGNIDIVAKERSSRYWSGSASGEPYDIVVQKTDPDSENAMDIIETLWEWDSGAFAYRQGPSKNVKAETLLEERIARVYTGGVDVFEKYLEGAWYKENGDGSGIDMLFFDPETREFVFYDGSVQEVYVWGQSNRATAKRLYTRTNNAVIPSLSERLIIIADSWDGIRVKWERSDEDYVPYRRLGQAIQSVLDETSVLEGLVVNMDLTGVWKSPGGAEIVFDLPHIDWRDGDETRSGTASLFMLGGTTVLQIQFMKRNGALEETRNWVVEYDEDRDDTRAIRSLSLSPAVLSVDGVRIQEDTWRRFEQIEVLSAEN